MALPKVSPGTYNYGEYANPTPIRYRGGEEAIGQAIGQGLAMTGQILGEKIKQKKLIEKQNNAIMDKIIADTYSRASKEARENNSEEVMKFANEAGQLEIDYRNGVIDRNTYVKKKAAIEDGLQNLTLLQNLGDKIDLENVTPSVIKDDQSFENYLLQKSLESNNAKRVWDGEQWFIEYNSLDRTKLDPSKAKENNSIPDDAYVTKRVPLSEISANPDNFFKIKTKINFDDEPMQKAFQTLAKKFDNTEGKLYMTQVTENGYEKLDESKAVDAYSNSAEVEVFYNKMGKDIAEDILGQDFNPEDQEQVSEIKSLIASEVINKAEKVGVRAPKEPQPKPEKAVDLDEKRTGMDLRERSAAFNRIQGLKPGESMELDFVGTNDFRKEKYIVGKSESGKIIFQREDQEEPSEISQQDLMKEFGLQELMNSQKPSAQDLINKYSK